jgi:RhoGAP domain
MHQLRAIINNGKQPSYDTLEKFQLPVVASVLKLYLLQLPDPVVSSQIYDVIKTIYTSAATEGNETARVQVVQNALGQLRLANIATLDALTTHFTRLIELTSADEDYISRLATILAPCILRPRLENTLTMNEKYSYRLVRDLLAHKDQIFGELKRQSSLKQRQDGPPALAASSAASFRRARGLSTDERSRKDMELERQHAVVEAARSRGVSPGGGSRIRRERSPNRMSGGAESRFPVAVHRQSLEVPGHLSPTVAGSSSPGADKSNGSTVTPSSPVTAPPPTTLAPKISDDDKPLTYATGGPLQDFPEGGGEE